MEIKHEIENLKLAGQISIWRYTENDRNYPGWHLTVDRQASQTLLHLFDLMDQCDWSTKKSFGTNAPTDNQLSVPNNRQGTARWSTKPTITFTSNTSVTPDYWTTKEKKEELEITFSKDKLEQLRQAIADISNGKGDISIGNCRDENILTFWWRLEK